MLLPARSVRPGERRLEPAHPHATPIDAGLPSRSRPGCATSTPARTRLVAPPLRRQPPVPPEALGVARAVRRRPSPPRRDRGAEPGERIAATDGLQPWHRRPRSSPRRPGDSHRQPLGVPERAERRPGRTSLGPRYYLVVQTIWARRLDPAATLKGDERPEARRDRPHLRLHRRADLRPGARRVRDLRRPFKASLPRTTRPGRLLDTPAR